MHNSETMDTQKVEVLDRNLLKITDNLRTTQMQCQELRNRQNSKSPASTAARPPSAGASPSSPSARWSAPRMRHTDAPWSLSHENVSLPSSLHGWDPRCPPTRDSLRRLFGSAGVLTRAAGCSETRQHLGLGPPPAAATQLPSLTRTHSRRHSPHRPLSPPQRPRPPRRRRWHRGERSSPAPRPTRNGSPALLPPTRWTLHRRRRRPRCAPVSVALSTPSHS
jgi:hypothetical protein